MSNERDELAREVFVADNHRQHRDDAVIDFERLGGETYAHRIADGLLAAGYRKPQQVTTVEELDALPAATVVKDALTQVFEKQEAGIWHDGPHDWLAFDGKFWDVDAIHLPAAVLHVGGAS